MDLLNIPPLADLATMPPKTLAEMPRFALRREDRAYAQRNSATGTWWSRVWINAEIAIEERMS